MKKTVKNYKKAEVSMNIIANISNLLLVSMLFYIIGIAGALECDTLSLQTSVTKIVLSILICTFLFIIKKIARYMKVEYARERIYFTHGWC